MSIRSTNLCRWVCFVTLDLPLTDVKDLGGLGAISK
jgi:hypothetical protein